MGLSTQLSSHIDNLLHSDDRHFVSVRYKEVRRQTNELCAPLAVEDYVIQTMADVSPPKWHLAHTSWFFETFLLIPFLKSYREFHEQYGYL